jgi:hypothetical protein
LAPVNQEFGLPVADEVDPVKTLIQEIERGVGGVDLEVLFPV